MKKNEMTALNSMCCAIALIFATASAQATLTTYEADITFKGMGAHENIDITSPIYRDDAPTGALILEKTWGNNPNWANGTLIGFCVEIDQYASKDSLRYDEIPMRYAYDSETADALNELWGRYFDPSWATSNSTYDIQATAFQMAVWEIIYDGPDSTNFWRDNFKANADSETNNLANVWIASLDGTGNKAYNLKVLQNDCGQDFLVQATGAVPEPMTILLLISAVPYLLSRRKRAS